MIARMMSTGNDPAVFASLCEGELVDGGWLKRGGGSRRYSFIGIEEAELGGPVR